MKKIGALILLFALLCASAMTLASCGSESDVPDEMQLVAGGEALGYYFYAPEEWTVSSIGGIKAAYVSRVDTTSISFTEIDPDTFPSKVTDKDAYFFDSYFTDSLSEFPNEPKLSAPDGETTVFGKEGERADKAKKYTYTYEYFDYTANKTFKFGFMQILMKKADRYYIFTYSASTDARNGGEQSYYDFYLVDEEDKDSKITRVIKEFRFVGTPTPEAKPEYTVDDDGYILISDSGLSGFDFYVPDSYTADYASAIVSATHTDGSNVSLTSAVGTNENVNTYMLRRFGELDSTVDNIEYELMFDENGEPIYDPNGKQVIKYESIKFGNADAANKYRYSFTYNGEKYEVCQIIVIEGWRLSYKGYVFTYTAKEANYGLHLAEVEKIISKVNFK